MRLQAIAAGDADAFVSGGSTGPALAAALKAAVAMAEGSIIHRDALPAIATEFHASTLTLSDLGSVLAIGTLGALGLSTLADRFGRKRLIAIGVAGPLSHGQARLLEALYRPLTMLLLLGGFALLLISADLDELIGLSDRIEVILRGRMVGTFDPARVTPQELGSAMTGGND